MQASASLRAYTHARALVALYRRNVASSAALARETERRKREKQQQQQQAGGRWRAAAMATAGAARREIDLEKLVALTVFPLAIVVVVVGRHSRIAESQRRTPMAI